MTDSAPSTDRRLIQIIVPDYESLTAREQALVDGGGEWPVHISGTAEEIVKAARAIRIQRGLRRRRHVDANTIDPSRPLDDDTLIDQRCPRFPRAWFIKAAKAGLFPASKNGKWFMARYRDVKAAFEAQANKGKKARVLTLTSPSSTRIPTPSEPEPRDDALDDLRAELGLRVKE